MKILLVEDNIALAEALTEALIDQKYDVDVVNDGEAGWEKITSLYYDLILLDVMLPKLDGVSLCRRLRSSGYHGSVLMITALDTSTDKVNSLDAGADDYVVKPVDLPELLARMRALLRRGGCSVPPVLEWERLQLDPSRHKVTYNQQPVHLTPKEYSCLELFLRNSQRIINREFIIEHLWLYNLFHFLQHPDAETRGHVARLLGRISASEASIQLMGLASDNEEFMYCENGEFHTSTVAKAAAEAIQAIQKGPKNEQ